MRKLLLGLIFVTAIVASGCAQVGTGDIPAEKYCETDADCVPASCCHASDAVNSEYAPDCSDTFCTSVCEPGTLDCNQGEVRCIENSCEAVIFEEGQ